MIRFFDILVSITLLIALFIFFILIAFLIYVADGRPIFFKSERIGKNQSKFTMLKFRTLKTNAPLVDTESFIDARSFYIPSGKFLRTYSIDELPQLINVLVGEMSLVGYRPALPSQSGLNKLRQARGIHNHVPGITGLAQIRGRDQLTIKKKVALDAIQERKISICYYGFILASTVIPVFFNYGVKH